MHGRRLEVEERRGGKLLVSQDAIQHFRTSFKQDQLQIEPMASQSLDTPQVDVERFIAAWGRSVQLCGNLRTHVVEIGGASA